MGVNFHAPADHRPQPPRRQPFIGKPPRKQLVQKHPNSVNIRPGIALLKTKLLRSRIARRSHNHRIPDFILCEGADNAKIDYFDNVI